MSQYFENDKKVKSQRKIKEVIINNDKFSFITDNGVFSKQGLDFGTRVLLESLPDNICGDVLDIGCGYGPIGIYLKKKYNVNVDMVDVNERSLSLAKDNANLNKVETNIFYSDAFSNINKQYDFIVTNPPIRVGKIKLYEILFGCLDHLKENGKVYFVINKDQGAKSVLRDLNEKCNAKIIKKDKGFYIILIDKL